MDFHLFPRVRFDRRGCLALAAMGLMVPSACVPRSRYDECLKDASQARAAAATEQKDASGRQLDLQRQLSEAEAATQERDARLSELTTSDHNTQSKLDEATAINQQLREELGRLGKDVDKMLAERGTLSKSLEDAKIRLEELRKAEADAEARTALFGDFARRFKPLIDAGQLRVESQRGELVLSVAGDLLFEFGKTDLRTAGRGALMEIAKALESLSPPAGASRPFLVTGHVDAPDARGHHARSALELTALRSVAVVLYLVSLGVSPAGLTAAGAGASDPVAAGDSAEARAKNRRLDIRSLPIPRATEPAAGK